MGSGVLEDLKYILGDTTDLIPLSWLPLRITLNYKDVRIVINEYLVNIDYRMKIAWRCVVAARVVLQ